MQISPPLFLIIYIIYVRVLGSTAVSRHCQNASVSSWGAYELMQICDGRDVMNLLKWMYLRRMGVFEVFGGVLPNALPGILAGYFNYPTVW